MLVLVLGILRGTVFGRIQSIDALTTTYGIVWIIALVFTLGLIFTGARFMGPQLRGTQGRAGLPRARASACGRCRASTSACFGVVFTCMILMRFL